MVVAETVPPDGVSVMVDPNPAPEVVEISYPAGAVITRLDNRFVAETV